MKTRKSPTWLARKILVSADYSSVDASCVDAIKEDLEAAFKQIHTKIWGSPNPKVSLGARVILSLHEDNAFLRALHSSIDWRAGDATRINSICEHIALRLRPLMEILKKSDPKLARQLEKIYDARRLTRHVAVH